MDPFSSLAVYFLFVDFPGPPDLQFALSPQVFPFPFLPYPFPSCNQTLRHPSFLGKALALPPSDCFLQNSEAGKEQEIGWEWLCVVGLGRFSLGSK